MSRQHDRYSALSRGLTSPLTSPDEKRCGTAPGMPHASQRLPGVPGTNAAWGEVYEMCRKGFQAKMNTLGQEILEDVRNEIEKAMGVFRSELVEALDERNGGMNSKLSDLAERSLRLQQSIDQANNVDFKRLFDLTPVLEEIRSTEVLRQDSDRKLNVLEKRLDSVTHQIEQARTDVEEEVVRRLSTKMNAHEEQLTQITDMQTALHRAAENIAKEVMQMKKQEEHYFSEMLGSLDLRIKCIAERSSHVDMSPVMVAVQKNQEEVLYDFNILQGELGKIQKALLLDYADPNAPMLNRRSKNYESTSAEGDEQTQAIMSRKSARASTVGLTAAPATITDGEQEGTKSHAQTPKARRRFREFWCQTEERERKDDWVQTDPLSNTQKKKNQKDPKVILDKKPRKTMTGREAGTFNDAEALKQKARQALCQPPYNVQDFYHTSGHAQMIARSVWFENITLAVVAINAIWISIDTDLNEAIVLIDAEPVFQLVEHSFCLFFVAELAIRFAAFEIKSKCLRDFWFVFDLFLVTLMVIEDWILSVVMLALGLRDLTAMANINTFRLVRLVKLLRLSRLAKVLRALPELVIIIKGIGFAARSVFVFLALWGVIIYVFAIVLRQLAKPNDVLAPQYFSSVPHSFSTLLLNGLLPDNAPLVNDLAAGDPIMWPIMVAFVLLVGVTIMYMLVGVLVDVIGVIATTEKEGLVVNNLAVRLRESMEMMGYDVDERQLGQYELSRLLVEPEICKVISDVGVDVVLLVDMLDLVYEEVSRVGGMTFENLVETILNMRGQNPATIKDIKESLKAIKSVIKESVTAVSQQLTEKLNVLEADVRAIRDEVVVEEEDDDPFAVVPELGE
eukprot:TRINITY_DN77234_c0_g1_i1.p1 TRINITY_DN77234_c0_g1~~TRINITY_DN77234_c0_g1_i1.p1  ORF type:complete len:850 (-),score=205.70 TRINITY_DN77234_c0_g1_i1:21-2570(-)